jgi:hypothetical protein
MGGSMRDEPEPNPAEPDAELEADPSDGAQSIGAYLSAQRRLRGISIEELAQQTRIPLRSLERLESGSFDADVDGFVRGFVRTVASALGLDADEALNRALQEPGGAVAHRVAPKLSIKRVLVAVAGIVLLGGLGFGVQLIAISVADSGRSRAGNPVLVRRDPVRALAEAQGVAALAPEASLASKVTRPAEGEEARAAGEALDEHSAVTEVPLAGPPGS